MESKNMYTDPTYKTAKMHIAAYNIGLVNKNHPVFEEIQDAVFAQDDLEGLYEFEELLKHEICEQTGAYVDNQARIDELAPTIQRACEHVEQSLIALQTAIRNQ